MKNGFICKTASCKLCGEYSRKRGCISKHCPYLAERVAAGALNYKGAVMEAFGSNPLFRDDLTAISRRLSESVWNGAGHKQRMEALRVYTCPLFIWCIKRKLLFNFRRIDLSVFDKGILSVYNCFDKSGFRRRCPHAS